MSRALIKLLITFFLLFMAFESLAGVIIGGTRIIYNGNKKQISISIQNPDKKPYLIQSWLELDSLNPTATIPFIVTPPLFRLNADASNSLRIVKTGALPEDRESVYWLNIKAIPTSDPNAQNQLLISVNNRIKLFYRPTTLNNQDAADAFNKISFSRSGKQLCASNPTPFYISFSELLVNNIDIKNAKMLGPMSDKQCWTIPIKAQASALQVKWSIINDFGAKTEARIQNL